MPNIPPILFCVFNRLDYVKEAFAKIKKAEPKYLFVAADGPRKNNKKDEIGCAEVRAWIKKNITWDCEVKYLFAGRNMGCSAAMKSAIDWFFNNVEEGIILEEDCVVADCFFEFCGNLLEKYRDEKKVMVITGNGIIDQNSNKNSDYLFGKGPFNEFAIATWRRAWRKNDSHLGRWPEFQDKLEGYYPDKEAAKNISERLAPCL